jgi:hypothetical protein
MIYFSCFENLAKFKCFWVPVTNENLIFEEICSILDSSMVTVIQIRTSCLLA